MLSPCNYQSQFPRFFFQENSSLCLASCHGCPSPRNRRKSLFVRRGNASSLVITWMPVSHDIDNRPIFNRAVRDWWPRARNSSCFRNTVPPLKIYVMSLCPVCDTSCISGWTIDEKRSRNCLKNKSNVPFTLFISLTAQTRLIRKRQITNNNIPPSPTAIIPNPLSFYRLKFQELCRFSIHSHQPSN